MIGENASFGNSPTDEHGLFTGAALAGVVVEERDQRDPKAWVAPRSEFMRAVFLVCPEVKDAVHAEWARFQQYLGKLEKRDPAAFAAMLPAGEGIRNQPFERALAAFPDAAESSAFWQGWATRWHLTAPWCNQVAISLCCDIPRIIAMDQRRWEPFRFECEGWDPEDPSASEERIKAAFAAKLAEHMDATKDRLRAARWIDPADHHTRAHYIWAARYQVRGESYEQIARDAGVKRSSVTDAVKDVFNRIDLPVRKRGKPGRPRKVRNTQVEP